MKHRLSGLVAVWAALLVSLSIILPGFLVNISNDLALDRYDIFPGGDPLGSGAFPESGGTLPGDGKEALMVPVYLTAQERTAAVPLEVYVTGVVAAEMPPEFELEALKAQAIAARTYIIRRVMDQDFSNVPDADAWVTDTVAHQAFLTIEGIKKNWGIWKTARYLEKVHQAVSETAGQIMTYAGFPIDATFFSTSNGFTENSEDYWNDRVPYLRSVPSPWDKDVSPKYEQTITLRAADVYAKLGIQAIPASAGGSSLRMQVLDRTEGMRNKRVNIAGHIFTGREIREKLGLPSTHFDWKQSGDKIEIITYGYGHGVGMSQYGAQGMALEGYEARQILSYYYQGVAFEDWQNVLKLPKTKNL